MPTALQAIECNHCRNVMYTTSSGPVDIICPDCSEEQVVYVEDQGEYYHAGDCYYWESDGEYHLEEETSDDLDDVMGDKAPYYRKHDDPTFLVGVELECYPDGETPREYKELLEENLTLQVVGDASLGGGGVEIQTPPLPLTEQLKLLSEVYDLSPITVDKRCGLHVNLSLDGLGLDEYKTIGRAMLHELRDMGESGRVEQFGRDANNYCSLDPSYMTDKYNAVRCASDRIELRIPAPSEFQRVTQERVSNAAKLFLVKAQTYLISINPEHPLLSEVDQALAAIVSPQPESQELAQCA